MKKGIFSSADDRSSDTSSSLESKRRRILALTPPPDIFLFNSEEVSHHGKDLDVKLDMLSSRNLESSSVYSSTLGLTSCDSNSRSSVSKSDNLNPDKKQLCDLDFFKLMSEDEEDNSESGMLSLLNESRYYEMVHNQDTNMNDLTKDITSNQTKDNSEGCISGPNVSTTKSIAPKESLLNDRKPGLLNSGTYSSSSSISGVTRDKFNGPPPNKTVFNCPSVNSKLSNAPRNSQRNSHAASNGFSYDTNKIKTTSTASKQSSLCDICHENFEYDYLLWIHKRIHIPKDLRLLCSFCPFVTSTSNENSDTKKGGISLLTHHIKNTHFKAIQCRVCKVFVAESRAEMSRHVYRAHMYDKKFYTKQFRDSVIKQTIKPTTTPTRHKFHPATLGKGMGKAQVGSRRQQQHSQNNLQHPQNIYCIL